MSRYVYQTETGEEARLPPVSVEVPVAQSIPYLKRRLEHISFGGHQVSCILSRVSRPPYCLLNHTACQTTCASRHPRAGTGTIVSAGESQSGLTQCALLLLSQFAVSQQELHMPVPHLENATALVTEYAHHQQNNTLTTFGLEPPGPHTLLLKAVMQVRSPRLACCIDPHHVYRQLRQPQVTGGCSWHLF